MKGCNWLKKSLAISPTSIQTPVRARESINPFIHLRDFHAISSLDTCSSFLTVTVKPNAQLVHRCQARGLHIGAAHREDSTVHAARFLTEHNKV